MNIQVDKSKGPGVYIPPPLFYVLIFALLLHLKQLADLFLNYLLPL